MRAYPLKVLLLVPIFEGRHGKLEGFLTERVRTILRAHRN